MGIMVYSLLYKGKARFISSTVGPFERSVHRTQVAAESPAEGSQKDGLEIP